MFFDTTDVRLRSLMPKAPGRLVEHLRLEGVSVGLGDDVWLKSREANIKLGGSLSVTRARDERAASRTVDDSAHYVLALTGTLSADRGTYLLDLTPVQREFQVQSGSIRFFGTPDFNPAIDVTAAYRVKQSQRADINVLARISGNFYPQPTLTLESDDPSLSPSDLVSYLVTGRPSVDLAASDPLRQGIDILLPTLSAYGSARLRDQFGGFVDQIQIQSGASDGSSASALSNTAVCGSPLCSFLSSTRIGAEKQLSSRLFLSVSSGLCGLAGIGTGSAERSGLQSFSEALEGKLEYRFPMSGTDQMALRLGSEPATAALSCRQNTGVLRSFIQTPQQVGISVFRSWTF
jgi:translocation and assembly module TamB